MLAIALGRLALASLRAACIAPVQQAELLDCNAAAQSIPPPTEFWP